MKLDYSIKHTIMWLLGIVGLFGTIAYVIHTGDILLWIISYVYYRVLWFFASNIGLHRYFAHKGFTTGPLRRRFLLWITVLTGVGSPISYTNVHRHHHKHSDEPIDVHSPKVDPILSSSGLWVIQNEHWWSDTKKVKYMAKDLTRDSEVMFMHRHYHTLWLLLLISVLLFGGWNYCLLFVLQPLGWNHIHSAMVNFFTHVKCPGSYRNHDTPDSSYNNKWIQLFLLGEGLHNNHHAYPSRYNQATNTNEFDPVAWVIDRFFKVEQ